MIITDVVLKTGENRYEMIAEAIDGLGDDFHERCKQAEKIFIKVNLIDTESQLAVTHIDAVRALLDKIRYCSQTPVVIGDAAYRGTLAAFRHFGYERLAEEYENIALLDLNDEEFFEQQVEQVDVAVRRPRLLKEVDFSISLTPLKIDHDSGIALTIKNWAMGTWIVPSRISASGRVWARWPWMAMEEPKRHHEIIANVYLAQPCDLGIIDGFDGMQGDGPVDGRLAASRVAIAGFDLVAVDAVGTTLMGLDPADIGYLSMLGEKKAGTMELSQINIPPMVLAEAVKQYEQPVGFEHVLTDWKE